MRRGALLASLRRSPSLAPLYAWLWGPLATSVAAQPQPQHPNRRAGTASPIAAA